MKSNKNGFQTLDKRQHRAIIPEKRETSEVSPYPVPILLREPGVSLNQEDRAQRWEAKAARACRVQYRREEDLKEDSPYIFSCL